MKKLLCLAAALIAPAAATAQDICAAADHRTRAMARWSAAVMEPPVFGEAQLLEGTQAARRGLVLARQSIGLRPRIRYLAAPVALVDAQGRDFTPNGVPLGRGAPITTWRQADGLKHCSIGWRNGLFGGATGDGHLRWVCFEDRDGDGAFENAWRPHSSNLGLSFSRIDMPIDPPVAALPEPPEGAAPGGNPRGTLQELDLERSIAVTRVNTQGIRIDTRIEQNDYKHRVERRDLPIGQPSEITLAGVTIAITPTGPGQASISARGALAGDDVQLMCDGSRLVVGRMQIATEFAFPNW
ncbi:hypothetical protein [Allosphingosinicella sp.]|jgi:hypothetical protein|uniref:hypothetical protein n=1 Tax=Allosphingosinicella sp. TaxID=2823234 RepID=UPI002EFB582E